MILTLKRDASESDIRRIEKKIKSYGFKAHYSKGAADITIGVIGENAILLKEFFEADPAVKHIVQISKPYKLAGRQVHPEDSVIRCGNKKIGGGTTPPSFLFLLGFLIPRPLAAGSTSVIRCRHYGIS